MRQLMLDAPDSCSWREVPDPEIISGTAALVRPIAVACCDLDVAVSEGRLPMAPGHALGHEGVAEVVAVGDEVSGVTVGDRVVVPFQINCGTCAACSRGATGSCASLPLMAMYGMAPLAGLDGGGFMADLLSVPFADAMLVPAPAGVDPVAIASMSDNIPDGWRAVGPYGRELAGLEEADRRVLVLGRLSIGLYAAAFGAALGARVDYVDTDPGRLAIAEKLGATVHDRPTPDKAWNPYPVTVHTTADPATLLAALRATWPDGVCTDTGIYLGSVELPMLHMYTRGVRLVTGRVNARAVIPDILETLSATADLAPVVQNVVPWEAAEETWPAMAGKTVYVRR
ncbi:alcohol dehydrogenase catalytic domain-containing protein [Mycolicibacterium arenosum]|uniref:Alcohol dehydrogenase catalytic domain-containing protein n=1 Tax=Mycolicibacterium arenosum TaxID=2952157 RepID=A0ABT1M189_9MYCO|nr:alcohol dehydrogenase catalytic domain-containing protein [Mycolicibacterium sp. CAU 1645]MCP9272645.1 alcohol dehydrogenase catalytic domain-containing protein [Mycolicibacterium sp. CAU 1645]